MVPQFGVEISTQSIIHPIALIALVFICLYILIADRKNLALPFILLAIFIPSAQRIKLGSLDFTLMRIAIYFTWFRIFLKNEKYTLRFITLDKVIILWGVIATVAFYLQHQSLSALINRMGYMTDTALVYFAFRCLIRDRDDIDSFIRTFFILSFPVLVFFLFEKSTSYNVFSVFGGVPARTLMRAGRLRVQGAFSHPILAGCFWAGILPFYFNRYFLFRNERLKMIIAIVVLLSLIVLSASSTPVLGGAIGIFVIFVYKYRRYANNLPFLGLLLFIALDIVMKAPVWHLIARIDISGGSTGWHRYHLIDQAIHNFGQWALVGTPSIEAWNVWANDITNQYILEGVRGGFFSMLTFIWIITEALRTVLKGTEVLCAEKDLYGSHLMWALGAALTVHAVNFIGVSYFGQIIMLQYLTIAMIGSMHQYEVMPLLAEYNKQNNNSVSMLLEKIDTAYD